MNKATIQELREQLEAELMNELQHHSLDEAVDGMLINLGQDREEFSDEEGTALQERLVNGINSLMNQTGYTPEMFWDYVLAPLKEQFEYELAQDPTGQDSE